MKNYGNVINLYGSGKSIKSGRMICVVIVVLLLISLSGCGDNDFIQFSNKPVTLAAGHKYLVGVMQDGSVVAEGRNDKNQLSGVFVWNDITSIATGHSHTVVLKSDGTVVAVGNNGSGQCDVSEFPNGGILSRLRQDKTIRSV